MHKFNLEMTIHDKNSCNGCLCYGASSMDDGYNCYKYVEPLKIKGNNTANVRLERLDICKQNDKEKTK